MPGLLNLMLREEYRLHVSYSSSRVFFSLPLYVLLIAFFLGATLNSLQPSINLSEMLLFVNGGVFVYGMGVGAFGFLGQTYLERRTGRANFLVAMPFLLPFSFRKAFASLYLRDIIFYTLLIIIPGMGGVMIASLVAHFRLTSILLATLAVFLSFLLGMSFSFMASVAYMHSVKLFGVVIGGFMLLLGGYGFLHLYPLANVLPPLLFQYSVPPFGTDIASATLWLIVSVIVVMGFSMAAILGVIAEPLTAASYVKDRYLDYHQRMAWARSYRSLLAKDILDMRRSGAISKMLLAYVAPLVFLGFTTWYVNHGLRIPVGFNTVFYAAMVGSFGVMFYSWLTNLDSIDYYETLPVNVPQLIRTKLITFFVLTSIISTAFVLAITLANGEDRFLWVALPVLYITSAYSVISTAYLTGLSPNSVLFSPGILSRFAIISILPDLCITILSFSLDSTPLIAAAGIGLVCFALLTTTLIFYRSLDKKWCSTGFT